MNWTRQQLKSNARLMVKKNWLTCVIVSLVVAMFAGGRGLSLNYSTSNDEMSNLASNVGGEWANYIVRFLPFMAAAAGLVVVLSLLFSIFVGNPLKVGGARFYLHNIHSKGEVNDMAFAFQNQYLNVVKVLLVNDILIALWTLLFIIPGVIKAYQYYLVPYLLADNPEMEGSEARELSTRMMEGEKMNTFILELSFILWNILSSLTLGIVGLLWVNPYIDATTAELYTAIKTRWEEEHGYINY